jgi:hypothetical protein
MFKSALAAGAHHAGMKGVLVLGELEQIFENPVPFGARLLWRISVSFLHGG